MYRDMKLKNILSIFCFLFVAVACSSEDDMMNDVDLEVKSASEVYASLNVSLGTGNIPTKAVENADTENPTANESAVKNCYLAVFDADTKELLASRLYNEPESSEDKITYVLNDNIVFKVSSLKDEYPNLLFVAIAHMNSNKGDYAPYSSISHVQACTTYNELMAVSLKEDPTVLVKVGERTIQKDEFDKYVNVSTEMISQGGGKERIQIDVKQRSAGIELEELKVMSAAGAVDSIKVTSLQLINMVSSSNVGGQIENPDTEDSEIRTTEDITSDDQIHLPNLLGSRFYTYENPVSNNDKTKLRIKYSYTFNGKKETGSSIFTIKTPADNADGYTEEVKANHIYKLTVNITNGVVDVTVKLATKDWKYDSSTNDFEFTYKN